MSKVIYSKSETYSHGLYFVSFCWGQITNDVRHIQQGYFINTGAIIWLNQCHEATMKNMDKSITWIKSSMIHCIHNDIIKWKHFLCYWPFLSGIDWSPVDFPYKGQWHETLISYIFFGLCLNKWCFEMSSWSLWCHYNVKWYFYFTDCYLNNSEMGASHFAIGSVLVTLQKVCASHITAECVLITM